MVNKAKLIEVTAFKSEEKWYFRSIYEYEDEKGIHSVVIPKAHFPFPTTECPTVHLPSPNLSGCIQEPPYIWCGDIIYLEKSVCDLAMEHGYNEPGCIFDIVTKPRVREMTLDEIEKELGYKVKIVEKEASNGTDNL